MRQLITKVVGRGGFWARQHAPELLAATGVLSIIGGTVLTAKASMKVHVVAEDFKTTKAKIAETKELYDNAESGTVTEYTDEDVKKDLTILYTQTGLQLIRMYAPGVILTITGITCMLSSSNILKKRVVAVSAAYKVLEEGYAAYRKRVVEEYGEEKDLFFRTGLRRETKEVEVVNEKGKLVKVKKDFINTDNFGTSPYSRIYSRATSSDWMNGSIIANEDRLEQVQRFCNDRLQARGYMFFNEVMEELGFEPTIAGQEVGWLSHWEIERLQRQGLDYHGDGYIDFLSLYTNNLKSANRQGTEEYAEIPLDFNVDGPILSKLAMLKLDAI